MSKQVRRKMDAEEVVEVTEVKTTEKKTTKAKAVPKKKDEDPAVIPKKSKEPELKQLARIVKDNIVRTEETVQDHDERISLLEETMRSQLDELTGIDEDEPEVVEIAEEDDEEETTHLQDGTRYVHNGVGIAYKFWDEDRKCFDRKASYWAAKMIAEANKAKTKRKVDPIWVMYVDGKIDHVLSKDEVIKYCP